MFICVLPDFNSKPKHFFPFLLKKKVLDIAWIQMIWKFIVVSYSCYIYHKGTKIKDAQLIGNKEKRMFPKLMNKRFAKMLRHKNEQIFSSHCFNI